MPTKIISYNKPLLKWLRSSHRSSQGWEGGRHPLPDRNDAVQLWLGGPQGHLWQPAESLPRAVMSAHVRGWLLSQLGNYLSMLNVHFWNGLLSRKWRLATLLVSCRAFLPQVAQDVFLWCPHDFRRTLENRLTFRGKFACYISYRLCIINNRLPTLGMYVILLDLSPVLPSWRILWRGRRSFSSPRAVRNNTQKWCRPSLGRDSRQRWRGLGRGCPLSRHGIRYSLGRLPRLSSFDWYMMCLFLQPDLDLYRIWAV